jgi:hypothetical protein
LAWLGAVDSFVNEGWLGIVFVGLVECLVLGWAYDTAALRRHANSKSDWAIGRWWEWSIKVVIPVVLGGLVVWSFIGEVRGPSLLLGPSDLKDAGAMAGRLEHGEDPLSRSLGEQLSPETQAMLGNMTEGEKATPEQQRALLDDLNAILKGPALYEEGLFVGVAISRETKQLLGREDADILRVNRLLLQEAYPELIAPTKNVGGFLIDAQGDLVGKNVLGLGLSVVVLLVAIVFALWRPDKQARIVEYDT